MWIVDVGEKERYSRIVNLQKVLRIAFMAAKKVEARISLYREILGVGEEVTFETGVLCKVVASIAGSRPASKTVGLQVVGTRTPHLKRVRKPKFFVGHFDEDGCFEEIAEVFVSPRILSKGLNASSAK